MRGERIIKYNKSYLRWISYFGIIWVTAFAGVTLVGCGPQKQAAQEPETDVASGELDTEQKHANNGNNGFEAPDNGFNGNGGSGNGTGNGNDSNNGNGNDMDNNKKKPKPKKKAQQCDIFNANLKMNRQGSVEQVLSERVSCPSYTFTKISPDSLFNGKTTFMCQSPRGNNGQGTVDYARVEIVENGSALKVNCLHLWKALESHYCYKGRSSRKWTCPTPDDIFVAGSLQCCKPGSSESNDGSDEGEDSEVEKKKICSDYFDYGAGKWATICY